MRSIYLADIQELVFPIRIVMTVSVPCNKEETETSVPNVEVKSSLSIFLLM